MVSWLVTGSNRGIGLGFIRKLSADPNNIVFAVTRNKSTSSDLLELESRLKNVHVLQADITDVPSLRNIATEVGKVTGGTLDVLVNNGAYLPQERADYTLDMYDGKEDLLDEDFGNFFKVNTLGVIKTINVFLPLLRKASQTSLAKIITISSGAGDSEFVVNTAFDSVAAYSVSKAAVNMVTAKYAARFKGENLLFLSISPGLVNTHPEIPEEVVLESLRPIITKFQTSYPEWDGKPLTPEQSVTTVLDIVSRLTTKDSGASLTHNGGTKDWL
ncbi:hypothetical protein QCA50_016703 [Cerrena zonata]|uniref:NAD(P)-binding protein n=1 Tax=Cerrena zonata TaxID=2478898 RepID=A0AAW0FMG6_9APHY